MTARPLPPPGPVEARVLADLQPHLQVRSAEVGGCRLRYLEGGSGPPLVLLHGRGQAAPTWFTYLTALSRHRRVIAVDLPGHGQSTAPPFTGKSPEDGLSFFAAPIEALLLGLGLTDAALLGHSVGGLISMELALRGKLSVERLLLIDPMGLGPSMTLSSRLYFRVGPENVARRIGLSGYHRLFKPPPTPFGARLSELSFELLAIPGGRPEAHAAFNTLFPLVGSAFHRLDALAKLEQPTLVVWGERDEVLPLSNLRRAAERFRRAEVHVLALGHAPHLDRPEVVLPLLLGFLGRAPPGHAAAH